MSEPETEQQKAVADAILLERAAGVMDRRWQREMMIEPTAHAVYHWLRGSAWQLRKDAGQDVPPWSDPDYPHVRRDINENFSRPSGRQVFE